MKTSIDGLKEMLRATKFAMLEAQIYGNQDEVISCKEAISELQTQIEELENAQKERDAHSQV